MTTQINTLLASLPNQYQLAGSTSSFAVIQGITGSFTSLGAATGSFTSVVGANYYNGANYCGLFSVFLCGYQCFA